MATFSVSTRNSKLVATILLASAVLLAGCPKKTADLELEAARKAIADAQAKKARNCASETFVAAEAAIAEAQSLAEEGEVERAKQKAMEAKALADQASAASPAGCDKSEEDAEAGPAGNGQTENIGAQVRLEDVLDTIYFDYNDASIREDSKVVLSRVAAALGRAQQKIEIEGHCDVRGSTEYNLHLGERRARAVEKYLVTQGVKPDQIAIISYGEERPIDLGGSEESHQRNRRAELKKP